MKKLVLCSLSIIFNSILLLAQTNTISDGNWTTGGNWSSGVPGSGDIANIGNNMVLNTNLTINNGTYTVDGGTIIDATGGTAFDITVSGTGYFEVDGDVTIEGNLDVRNDGDLVIKGCDTLTVGGNVEFRNNSSFSIEACGVLIVEGDLYLRNNHNSEIHGNILVKGNLESRNDAVITGTGNIDVDGTVDIRNSSTIFGSTSDCTPGPCDYGPGGSLPIELVSFEASLAANGTIQLQWVTASEINNHYFTLERAENNGPFEEISIINGAGNSQQTLNYQYTDDSPLAEKTYYRLKQTDFDGKFSFSKIQLIKSNGSLNSTKKSLKIYPNPASDQLSIVNSLENILKIEIFNTKASLVKTVEINSNQNLIELPINDLTPGLYFIQMNNAFEQVKGKFIVLR